MSRSPNPIVAIAHLLAGCASVASATAQDAPPPPAAAVANPAIWPTPNWPLQRRPAVEARISALIARMSPEEKVGQVIQGDISTVTPDDVKRYHLGSVLNGGNSGPGGNDLAPREKWLALADAYYDASVDTSDGKVAIPIIWGTDAVHGHSNIIGATLFPHNIGLGAANDPALIERIGRATALEIRTTGQEWTFAPTVTVPQDFRWGRAYEGYSSDPELVASYTGRMIRGLQGPPSDGPLLAGPYVIASTKHFLADGATTDGVDQGDARIPETVLRNVHGAPYVPAIEQGVATVMASFSSWNGVKMTGNRSLLTGVLKERMNFDGFVVSDWNAHGQVAGCTNADCPRALLAGIDMYMAPDTWKPLYESLLGHVKAGRVPMARLDEAVARILRTKMRVGLFDAGRPSTRRYSGQWDLLGGTEHRAIAREAVRKSMVLLKNAGSVLPIRPGARVLIAGDSADDIARQSGGWTLTWQGTGVDNSHFPGATSIADGIAAAVKEAGGRSVVAPDGRFAEKPDVAIVVFGETPYAEFQGDRKTLQLPADLRGPYATMTRLKAAGVPVVAVMITGRPLFVNPELNAADAFAVAWLPGSEGGGVADVLVAGRDGRARHDFTGRLPATWPATARADGPTLFDRGYGLTLGAVTPWKALSEETGVAEADAGGVWMALGQPAPSWSLHLGDGVDAVRITSVPANLFGGRVAVTATDTDVQEGARRIAVARGATTVSLSSQNAVDLGRETNGDVLLTFDLRVDKPSATPPTLGLRCAGSNCGRPVALTSLSDTGRFVRYGVALKCFQRRGAAMDKVTAPFVLTLTGPTTVSLSRVALGTAVDRTLACPN